MNTLAGNYFYSLTCALLVPMSHAQIAPSELVAPKMEISDGNLNFTIQPSVSGRNYQLQWSDSMEGGAWSDVGVVRSGDGGNTVISTPHVTGVQKRFYRIALVEATPAPAGFSLISAGRFQMGDSAELTEHTVNVSAFYIGKYEVTKDEWDVVRAWGLDNGYTDLPTGNSSYASKGANHPVHSINWYAMVKWCSARSQKEGLTPCYTVSGATYKTGSRDDVVCNWSANGYRLPSEAEWETAARSGESGKRYPWGDTITHSQANYYSSTSCTYDLSPTRVYHPTYNTGGPPFTAPVDSFSPNGYGLFNMSGNVWEWCWDWYGASTYVNGATNPRGAASGTSRVGRGGSWGDYAVYCRVANRSSNVPGYTNFGIGCRIARSSVP